MHTAKVANPDASTPVLIMNAHERLYTPRDLAQELGLSTRQIRARLRALGLGVGSGQRYEWNEETYGDIYRLFSDDPAPTSEATSVDPDEVEHFSTHAEDWWSPDGTFAQLHRINPVRLSWLRGQLVDNFERDPSGTCVFSGLKFLDVGCGGGLVCEPLTRLGAEVTGIDASAEAIRVAREHADQSGLQISYRQSTVEDVARENPAYDAVIALEILEHVANRRLFLQSCRTCLKPGGLIILSTLNRTPASALLGVLAAEYVLRWVPRGTHDWRKFVRPIELVRELETVGLTPLQTRGMVFDLLDNQWRLGSSLEINYLASAVRLQD